MEEVALDAPSQPNLGVGPRINTPSHSHSSIIRYSGRRLLLQPCNHITGGQASSSDRSSPLLQGLNYLRDRLYQTHLTQHQLLYVRVVSSHSKASTVNPVEANQPDSYSGGGAGDGLGNSKREGSDRDKGEGELDGDKGMAMSMSQKFTLGYAALLGVGGVMGYLKSGSQKSLLAGGLSASLLYYVYTELPARPVLASSVGLGISGALVGVMGSRFKRTGKVFPAGVVSLVSLVMTGGYLHGILRSMH